MKLDDGISMLSPIHAQKLSLTSIQKAIVECDAPAVLVTASAGTGKTEVLARRVERFLDDPKNNSARAAAITYTTRAAEEFRLRVEDRIGGPTERVVADTIHGFAYTMLSQHGAHVGLPTNFGVITKDEDRAELIQSFAGDFESDFEANSGKPFNSHKELLNQLDLARANDVFHPELEKWRAVLHQAGAVDFGEILSKAQRLLHIPAVRGLYERLFGLIVIDEAQNLTLQQYLFLKALSGPLASGSTPRIQTVLFGDPKQSLVSFAGGDYKLMGRFASEYGAHAFELTQNFRSSKVLAAIAHATAEKLGQRDHELDFSSEFPANGIAQFQQFDNESSEGEAIANWVDGLLTHGLPNSAIAPGENARIVPEDVAILSRSSATLREASKSLQSRERTVAWAQSDDDFMATPAGVILLSLMRANAPSHRFTATMDLRRRLGCEDLDINEPNELASALNDFKTDYLHILHPLIGIDDPAKFVLALQSCQIPNTASASVLASWEADKTLVLESWSEYVISTPVADRSWSQFILFFDRTQRGRDLGPGVRLLTVHKAQGREFKAVAIIGMNDGQFPRFQGSYSSGA